MHKPRWMKCRFFHFINTQFFGHFAFIFWYLLPLLLSGKQEGKKKERKFQGLAQKSVVSLIIFSLCFLTRWVCKILKHPLKSIFTASTLLAQSNLFIPNSDLATKTLLDCTLCYCLKSKFWTNDVKVRLWGVMRFQV